MQNRKKSVLVFDGDCGFCRRWIRRWEIQSAGDVEFVPYQEAAGRFEDIPPEDFARAIHLIEPDGRVFRAAQAVFRALASTRKGRLLLWAYEKIPGFAPASEAAYRVVAGRRHFFSRLTLWPWGPSLPLACAKDGSDGMESHHVAEWLFARGIGLVFLAAFLSLIPQITALIGSGGILPAEHLFRAAYQQLGAKAYWIYPTLCWLDQSDSFLRFLCWAGAALSVLVVSGFLPGPLLLASWAIYLSLVTVGRDFLGFQWDNLLLEVGFVAAFVAPWSRRLFPSAKRACSQIPLWMGRWILFRLMFESGCVKILSADPAWRGLTALFYHYETQPLPTWLGWYAHQLPRAFQKFSTLSMFAVELVAPWLIFGPRRLRLAAFALLATLQILIALTGNYCFFNALTLLLCLLLLDDEALAHFLPRSLIAKIVPPGQAPARRLGLAWLGPLAAAQIVIGGFQLAAMFAGSRAVPGPARVLMAAAAPFRTINNYGLFAVMTTRRLEIFIEGSEDGALWYEYRFKWKPGDPRLRPAFVAPYQPRLDWQMWFAALSSHENNMWFMNLMVRLSQGSKEVAGLFANNPFAGSPPRYLRARVYEYHFTSFSERSSTGAWWTKEKKGLYCPVMKRGD